MSKEAGNVRMFWHFNCSILVYPTDRCKCIFMFLVLDYILRLIDLWFDISMVECRKCIPEETGLKPNIFRPVTLVPIVKNPLN